MRVRVLGAIEVVDDAGAATAVTSPSQRVVLAVLAAHAGEVVRADVLVDALWGDRPPPSAPSSLRTYVSRLRRQLGDSLVIHAAGYELRASVDAVELERRVSAPAADDRRQELDRLDDALALWRGQPFPGLDDVGALEAARERLSELALLARERRGRTLLDLGRPAEAAVDAGAVVAVDPWRERAWELLIDALGADRRPAEALRAYQRVVTLLGEAGLEPGDGLRRAESDLFAPPRSAPTATPVVAPAPGAAPATTLPVPASSLVGRDADLATIAASLLDARLVTLLGTGGVGKTRLALEAARSLAGRHEWGARLIALESVEDPADVPAVVLDALGLASEGAPVAERLAAAGHLDLLVVLDNCEHVLDAAAAVVTSLCTGGDRIRVLVTSRERLEVPGERVLAVRPLPTESAGRALLVDRARATRPDVDLSDIALLDRVVDRLDGLPLAIEMAASQLASSSLAELAHELDERLDVLATRRRDAPERHRSLTGLVRWTTQRIDVLDRAVLGELSIFAGPFTLDDAIAVTGRPDAGLAARRLAERSLLTVGADGPTTRFAMIGPVRACAAALLAEAGRTDELAGAHAGHLVAVARAADVELRTEREADAVARLDAALPDLRAAHRWAAARAPATAVALSAALFVYGQTQVRLEVLGWAAELAGPDGREAELLAGGTDPDELAVVLGAAAHAALLTGDLAGGRRLAERGLAVTGADSGIWAPLEAAGDVALFEGRLDDAVALVDGLEAPPGHPHLHLLLVLGRLLPTAYRGDHEEAVAMLDELAAVGARSPSDRAWVAYAEGDVILDRDPPRALAALERAVALADQVGDRYIGGIARVSLCSLQARVGRPAVAAQRFVDAIDHWRRQGATTHLVTALRNLPVLLDRFDQPVAAAELMGTLEQIDAVPTWGEEAARLDAVRRAVERRLSVDEARRARAAGASRSVDAAARAARTVLAGVAVDPEPGR